MIPSHQATLATYSVGKGPSIIFLHGGPGDTHHYMKKMAEPLFKDFHCIFFDQRVTGQSTVEEREPESFQLEFMLADIFAIQKYYQTGPCMLVGHSWGAMYGLFACMKNPKAFTKAALLNMGPLDNEAGEKNAAHLLEVLSEQEKQVWKTLRLKRNEARDNGDLQTVQSSDIEMMHLRVKSWIYDPKLHEAFLKDYFEDPPPDRNVNKWVWESLDGWFSWEQVSKNTTDTWLLAGAHDATPVAQAERLNDLLPSSHLSVYEKCGHIPWMEHTDQFFSDLSLFFKKPVSKK
jgi:pimeloyl-ACP methyl ester carboxylesterase